ncbi:MAG TPA: anthranilate synthase component I family protein [Bryobacteraceae bacterium]|jgi:para-aminobenzoate synthetase component 1
MWADRPAAQQRRELVDTLRRVLPVGGFAGDPIARLSATSGIATITTACAEVQLPARGFDLIEAALEAWEGFGDARLFGYLGYELGAELEDVPHVEAEPGEVPDLYLELYQRWEAEQDRSLTVAAPNSYTISNTPTDEGFCATVARTVERIYKGELFQVNLCRRLETALSSDEILPLYNRLCEITPATYAAFIRISDSAAVLSASPELFLSVRNGCVRSCPIKGTRPRGATPEDDRAFAAALLASEKDRAELSMIVDVVRNDLGRVCQVGSVRVTRHTELMTLPTVHHTFSEVTGRLRPEYGPADLLRAAFPPASISGAPKIRAMEVAALEESYRRGPCMGSIGWIGMNGDMELSVAIRTAVADRGRVYYLAGCGITAESMPEEELAESEAKAAAFLRALG